MSTVKVKLPDGSLKEFSSGTTCEQVAQSISPRLAEACVAARVNDKLVDLSFVITSDVNLVLVKKDSKDGLEVIRHSTAHLLAHALKELYPAIQITIGPVTEEGFYYDVDAPQPLSPDDLPKIEERMGEIQKRNLVVHRRELAKEQAIPMFRNMGEHYKVEIIEGIPDVNVSVYEQGGFADLCRGPHVPNTARLGKFKLLSISGAYWRGDEKNKMLQRIYGTAFSTQKELDEHLKNLEEAKKRDHRRLGVDLELFTFLPVAPAMPFYLPKGTLILNLLREYIKTQMEPMGYQEVSCPQVMNNDLWKTSGHYDFYIENMYSFRHAQEGMDASLKPMNCPGHCALFGSRKHSYRELPVRYAEFTKLHRYERAGVTHGLFRTRAFSQDDGHIFCTPEQILEESKKMVVLIQKVYQDFGFETMEVFLATRPEKYLGTPENWEKATAALADSLKDLNVSYQVLDGEGAFYGPKIEFHVQDSIKRKWQCGTVQVDFTMPERFDLKYMAADGSLKTPVMIHRAILGSFERFFGILIEHFAGRFPLWLAPVQAVLINVNKDQELYVKNIEGELKSLGLRFETDLRNETLGYKIRDAQLKKIPIMFILGPQESERQTVSLRLLDGQNKNHLSLNELKDWLSPMLLPGGKVY